MSYWQEVTEQLRRTIVWWLRGGPPPEPKRVVVAISLISFVTAPIITFWLFRRFGI